MEERLSGHDLICNEEDTLTVGSNVAVKGSTHHEKRESLHEHGSPLGAVEEPSSVVNQPVAHSAPQVSGVVSESSPPNSSENSNPADRISSGEPPPHQSKGAKKEARLGSHPEIKLVPGSLHNAIDLDPEKL